MVVSFFGQYNRVSRFFVRLATEGGSMLTLCLCRSHEELDLHAAHTADHRTGRT